MNTIIDPSQTGIAHDAFASTNEAPNAELCFAPQRYVQYSGALPRPLPPASVTTSLVEAAFSDLRGHVNLHGRRIVIIGLGGREGRAALESAALEGAVVDIYQPGLLAAERDRLVDHVEKRTGKRYRIETHGWEMGLAAATICVNNVPASPAMLWEVARDFVGCLRQGTAIITATRHFLPQEPLAMGLRTGKIGAIYYKR